MTDRTSYTWLIVGLVGLGVLLLSAVLVYAQVDIYGDIMSDVYGNTPPPSYSYTAPPLVLPPTGGHMPSVQFGDEGLTYTYPGQPGGLPAVVMPPTGGQSYIYFGKGGAPDVIITPDGAVHYAYPGRK